MRLTDILPPSDLLRDIEGIEEGLRQRRRLGTFGLIGFFITSSIQIITLVTNSDAWDALVSLNRTELPNQWPYLLPLAIAVPLLLFSGWSRFWLKESKAPFRYTCSIDDFTPLKDDEAIPDFAWLSHDLSEMLTRRIGRLSLLEEGSEGDKNEKGEHRLESHIHIGGHYGIREKRDGNLFIEVMPRVRIGPEGHPETLAHPVTFKLDTQQSDNETQSAIDTKTYEQLFERIYSSVATEIYKQIQRDVEGKIELLPTKRFRAVALLHEADDYARSNTLDAYDEALRLYERAIMLFDPLRHNVSHTPHRRASQAIRTWYSSGRTKLRYIAAFFYERAVQPEILCARAEIGYTNMLLFRRILAGISGRRLNPVFETRRVAERAVERLNSLPPGISGRDMYLFNAYITLSLSWYYLGSLANAKAYLKKASEIDPPGAERNPMYLFTQAVTTLQLRSRMQLLRRAVELENRFEVAQFEFAIGAESLWRTRPTLENNVADMVFNEYMEVLRINPGNVGTWANLGYMHWLLGNIDDAKDFYENGREYKSIKRETFIAELDYGRARIAAEQGNFIDAYRYYVNAVSAYVAQGSSHIQDNISAYLFRSIDKTILQRYEEYRKRVKENYDFWVDVYRKGNSLRNILRSFSDGKNGETAAKNVAQFIRIIPECLTPSEKHTVATIAPDLDFESLSKKIDEGNHKEFSKILEHEEIVRLIESYLPTPRIYKSVLAFVTDEYGQACHYYFLRSGNAEWLDHARSAYRTAIDLNEKYIVPRYNLFRLIYHSVSHVEMQDVREKEKHLSSLEEIKKEVDKVHNLEPNWPDGLLSMAELYAKIAVLKLEIAGDHESEIEKFKQKRISFKQHDAGISKEIRDTSGRKNMQERSDDKIKEGPLKVRSSFGSVSQIELFTADFISSEETVRRRQKVIEREVRINTLRSESNENLKRALNSLQKLLPHKWIEMDPADLAGHTIKSLLQRTDIDWVKEFDDLQVVALFTWGKIISLDKSVDAEHHVLSLYLHLRLHFLPEHFDLHEAILALLERMIRKGTIDGSSGRFIDKEPLLIWCRETLQRQIDQWIKDDPGAYWILTLVNTRYIADEESRKKMLVKAKEFPHWSPRLLAWIGNQLLLNNAPIEARDAFEKAQATEDPLILLDIARGYNELGEKKKAVEICELVGSSKNRNILLELARFKREIGMFDDCRRILEIIRKRLNGKYDRSFLMKLADLYEITGDRKAAISIYKKINGTLEPDFAFDLGKKLINLRAWNDSIRILETTITDERVKE